MPRDPAFGQADLSNCEREQIHLPGSIQPHGALLVVREPGYDVVQASATARALLELTDEPHGLTLAALGGELWARIAPRLDEALDAIPLAVRCTVGSAEHAFDALVHRPEPGLLIVELERAGPPVDLLDTLQAASASIGSAPTLKLLGERTAAAFEQLTGYDRVMVYRFDQDGHGEVLSEVRRADLEPYLGNRYPASDIPQIARRLYLRNRVRVLVDIEYEPVPVVPPCSPIDGRELDMSLAGLRSMSPIHVQYLKNMGVRATLVTSLAVGGKLWGLVACHHYEPRQLQYELRVACELLGESVAVRIAALESYAQAQAELGVRRIEQRLIEAISREGDWRTALFDGTGSICQPTNATGAALLFEDKTLSAGEVPGTPELRAIGRWLDERRGDAVHATSSLGRDAAQFAPLAQIASGLLAVPLSEQPGNYLIWFRPERIHTVTWGGNPFKPVEVGDDPADLSPRRSFSQWHQQVEGTADAWSVGDLAAARLIGESVSDVVLQFRSLRMLILEDQLDWVSSEVRESSHPAVIADSQGRLLLINRRFDQLLRPGHAPLQWLDDLSSLFTERDRVGRHLSELVQDWRAWRSEVHVIGKDEITPVLLRADPVLASNDRALGFVLLFTPLDERKAAQTARRRFQEEVVERRAFRLGRNGEADLGYRTLAGAIVDNAQLAALEITDGVDLSRVPALLEGVETSVQRCTSLLEHLSRYAERDPGADR